MVLFFYVILFLGSVNMKNKFKITYEMTDKLLLEALNIDNNSYSKHDIGSYNKCKEWLEVNKDIYTIITLKDRCIGYINFMPISNDCFNNFKKGIMKDYMITKNDILPFSKDRDNKCLFCSIAIEKKYRDTNAINILIQAFKDKINTMKNDGYIISETIFDCVSLDGIKIATFRFDAKYICESNEGKIYLCNNIYENNREYIKLKFEEINKKNVKMAGLINYILFNESKNCGYSDYLDEIKNKKRFKKKSLPLTYLVYYKDIPVGIIGLFEVEGYPNDIWLNWFGVLEEYRCKGIGKSMLFRLLRIAQAYNRDNFRLNTYATFNKEAQYVYRSIMDICEPYMNEQEDKFHIKEGHCLIYSSSLTPKSISKWDNKFMNLKSENKIHIDSIELLKRDGIIE